MIIEITDIRSHETDVYSRLTEAQLMGRQNRGDSLFIAESPTVINYALSAGFEPVSLLMPRKYLNTSGKELIEKCGEIPVYTADTDVLSALTGFEVTRGIMCAMRRKPLPDLSQILSSSDRIAVLENITDPTNIGSIFRSAAALGMDAVLLSDSCCDPLYRRAARVSMGGVFKLPWTYMHTGASADIKALKSCGFTTFAMALCENTINIDDPILMRAERLAVILGSEGNGLCQSTIDECDYTVMIPMYNSMDSLNVAVAASICFWQICRCK